MDILYAVLGAALFYVLLIFAMNRYFKTDKAFPENLVKSHKDIMIMAGAEAVIACTGLLFGLDSNPPQRLILFYVLLLFMGAAAITDIKKRVIPNKLITGLLLIWAVYSGGYFAADPAGGLAAVISSAAGLIFSLLVFGTGYVLMKNKLG
ncbi:MAG: hypothetical protein NC078_11335, partial [Ruminococcus sp.]|nr:hypothetical protein [Ruminococcus sp.]